MPCFEGKEKDIWGTETTLSSKGPFRIEIEMTPSMEDPSTSLRKRTVFRVVSWLSMYDSGRMIGDLEKLDEEVLEEEVVDEDL